MAISDGCSADGIPGIRSAVGEQMAFALAGSNWVVPSGLLRSVGASAHLGELRGTARAASFRKEVCQGMPAERLADCHGKYMHEPDSVRHGSASRELGGDDSEIFAQYSLAASAISVPITAIQACSEFFFTIWRV